MLTPFQQAHLDSSVQFDHVLRRGYCTSARDATEPSQQWVVLLNRKRRENGQTTRPKLGSHRPNGALSRNSRFHSPSQKTGRATPSLAVLRRFSCILISKHCNGGGIGIASPAKAVQRANLVVCETRASARDPRLIVLSHLDELRSIQTEHIGPSGSAISFPQLPINQNEVI